MTTQGTTQQAEQLWIDAHDNARRGDLATAVRQLAGCYEILLALGDPRLREVHQRWTEVHRLYAEEAARAASAPTPHAATDAAAHAATEAGAGAAVEVAAATSAETTAETTADAHVAVVDHAAIAGSAAPSDGAASVADPYADVQSTVASYATVASVVADVPDAANVAGVDLASTDDSFGAAEGISLDGATSSIADSSGNSAGGLEAMNTAAVGAASTAAHAFTPSAAEQVAAADVVDALNTAIATSVDIHEQATLVPVPASTEAPPMALADAPVGLVSLEIEIDFVDGAGSTPPSVAPAPVSAASPAPATAMGPAEDDFGDVATELAASGSASSAFTAAQAEVAPDDVAPNDVAPNDVAPNDVTPNDAAPNEDLPALDFGQSSPVPTTTEPPTLALDPGIDALPAVDAARLDVEPLAASLEASSAVGAEALEAQAASVDPRPAVGDDLAFFEELLERVRANRRAA